MIALLRGAHEGNTAATAVGDRISRAPGDNCAKALQDAISVSCPGRTVGHMPSGVLIAVILLSGFGLSAAPSRNCQVSGAGPALEGSRS
jgi:hypothetical protein